MSIVYKLLESERGEGHLEAAVRVNTKMGTYGLIRFDVRDPGIWLSKAST